MPNTIQVKRGSLASLPTLNSGEFGFCTDTYDIFIGDGVDNHQIATRNYVDSVFTPDILANPIGIGGAAGASVPTLRRCTINASTGVIETDSSGVTDGPDLMLNGSLDESPDQQISAYKIWNAVWNDVADFRLLDDNLVYGMCYYDTITGAKICTKKCQKSVIGIASNTFGQGLGKFTDDAVPIAISGWVLAYVDKEYEMGTPLTNNKMGFLTKMTLKEKQSYPERLLAIYRNKEIENVWGPVGREIKVDDRHWVKVK
jgi:hypothetical protein